MRGSRFSDTADAYCWDDTERRPQRAADCACALDLGRRSFARSSGDQRRADATGRPMGGRRPREAPRSRPARPAVERSTSHAFTSTSCTPPTLARRSPPASARWPRSGKEGLVDAIGLCNVTVGQIEEARRITEIDSIQVELSVWHDGHDSERRGRVTALANRLQLLAYRSARRAVAASAARPRTQRSSQLAARHDATPFEIALAWLSDLSDRDRADSRRHADRDGPVGRPRSSHHADRRGSRGGSIETVSRAGALSVGRRDGRSGRRLAATMARSPLVMGLPGAGKSTFAASLALQGYRRLNRDEAGGTLRELLPALDRSARIRRNRASCSTTPMFRASRAPRWFAPRRRTAFPFDASGSRPSVEDAQTNAAWRIVSRYGRLPGDARSSRRLRADRCRRVPSNGSVPVSARARAARSIARDSRRVDVVPFERRYDPSCRQSCRADLVRRGAPSQPLGPPRAADAGRCRGEDRIGRQY